MSSEIVLMIVAGIVATAVGDLVTYVMGLIGLGKSRWNMVGRWLAGIPKGKFINSDLANSPVIPGESLIGWGFHYLTGIIYGVMYIGLCSLTDYAPTLITAVMFGAITVAAPYFVLKPGMGAGVMARKTPNPLKSCTLSLVVHLFFGLGLWLGAGLFYAAT